MPILSFRIKLLLAMMLVVAGVSAATLWITQRRVQVNYERMFRRQFDRQINYFVTLQETRLGAVREQCLKLSESVRLLGVLAEPDIEPEALYLTSLDEVKRVLGSMIMESRMAGVRGIRRYQATFFTFLDAEGHPIVAPDSVRKQLALGLARRRLEQKILQVRGALESPERQQVGYLSLAQDSTNRFVARKNVPPARQAANQQVSETNTMGIQEVIVTKIIDPVNEKVLGAMAIGFPVPDLVQQPAGEQGTNFSRENIQTGILLEDHLYVNPNVIPESIASQVARELNERMKTGGAKMKDDFACQIGDSQYRVFYELLGQGSAFPPAYQVCLYSMDEARSEQRELRWKILGSSATAMLGALLFSLVLSHGLSVPIRDLVSGTGEVQKGNFNVRVPVRSRDEIGRLAASFNQMAEGLSQKERYRTLLNQVADEKVAQQLISGEITLGGELRETSVLFCDIRQFTPLSQNMPPGEVIEMLNEHMTALTRIVKRHNGVLDKFVGDSLMALFGAPVSYGMDALDAARCAVELIREREKLNQCSKHNLKVGIGIATGTVVAGGMGSAERFHYTVLGERVNLAARLCAKAAGGEILIDQVTVDSLSGKIEVEAAPVMDLKGFSAPVRVYRLVSILVEEADATVKITDEREQVKT